jgi:hypothetical protein
LALSIKERPIIIIGKRRGLWKDSDAPKNRFAIGHPREEMITGQRAWRHWKDYLGVKRRSAGKAAL